MWSLFSFAWHIYPYKLNSCTAKNGRIFPWAEFSDDIYYSAPGRPLLRHGWSSVCSAVCSETLYFPVITGGKCQLSMFDSARSSLRNTNPKTKQTENVATHLIKQVKLDFEKNQISNAACLFTLTNDTGGRGPGLLYPLLPESIWLHFTAHFRDCPTLSKEVPTVADYSLLFPQREYKVSFLPLTKGKVIFVG